MDKIRIGLVDDESIFLEGLSLLLNSSEKLEVVLSATDGNNFIDSLGQMSPGTAPDVVLVDIQMKPIDGFELVQILKKQFPGLGIIILSSHYKNAMFGHMIKLGVSAFLPKNAKRDLLIEAIEKVKKTGVFFSEQDHKMLSNFVRTKSPKRYFNSNEFLTEREKEVLRLICSERTNQEIADALFLSKRTVESHRQSILDKIGAKNTAGLVIYALSNEIFIPTGKYQY